MRKRRVGAFREIRRRVRGIGVTLFVNWPAKPHSTPFPDWLFVRNVFAQMLPTDRPEDCSATHGPLATAPRAGIGGVEWNG